MPRRKQCSHQNDWCPSLLLSHRNYLVFRWQLMKLPCTCRSRLVCQESGLCVNEAQSQMLHRGKSSEIKSTDTSQTLPSKIPSPPNVSPTQPPIMRPLGDTVECLPPWTHPILSPMRKLKAAKISELFFKFFPDLRILIR